MKLTPFAWVLVPAASLLLVHGSLSAQQPTPGTQKPAPVPAPAPSPAPQQPPTAGAQKPSGAESATPAAPTSSPASVWGGVYTEAQAKRGAAVYKEACSTCHGGELEGDGFAPALVGPEFMGNWNGTSVGDLLERIRVSMPPGVPESVSTQEKADIVAYVLQHSKFPAGTTELAKESAALKTVKFEATKPGGN